MPPKCRFTRNEVVDTALCLVREKGMESLTARALGERLGSSSRPIFSLFESMEELRCEVIKSAHELYLGYLKREMQSGEYPAYKLSGMGYIRFAMEEKELFKLLFMRDRSEEIVGDEREDIKELIELIMKNTGMSEKDAYMFHLEIWVYVHGIAAMIATSYLPWSREDISRMLTDMYCGLKHRYSEGAK